MNPKIEKVLNSLEELIKFGIVMNPNNSNVKEILEEMYLLERKSKEQINNDNLLLDLIYNYDVSQFNIGGVSFYNPDDFFYDNEYICVGSDGAGDFIAINKNNNNIYNIVDGDLKVRIASSPEIFLDNLIVIGRFNFADEHNEDRLNEILNEITDNNESRKFYFSLMKSEK